MSLSGINNMKLSSQFAAVCLFAALAAAPLAAPAADAKKAAKPYPLKTCVVSDEKLGEMGPPHVITHEGQEIKFCCKSCVKDFDKDPKKFLKKVADAGKPGKK